MKLVKVTDRIYYLMGHDYPENRDDVMKYLKELENKARK